MVLTGIPWILSTELNTEQMKAEITGNIRSYCDGRIRAVSAGKASDSGAGPGLLSLHG